MGYDSFMDWALSQQDARVLTDVNEEESPLKTQTSATPVGPKPTQGKWATLDFPDPSGKVLKNQVVSIAIGHGLFDGECQQCYIVQMPKEQSGNQEDRYVALMQVDVRAWSFEFTQNAQCYLDQSICYGGGCEIPNAIKVDCNDIVKNSIPQTLSANGVQRFPGDTPDGQTCTEAHQSCPSDVFV